VSEQKKCCVCRACRKLLFALSFLLAATVAEAQAPKASPAKVARAHAAKPVSRHDDSVASKPAADLALRPQAAHKADALAHFVEGLGFEEDGEMERALDAYRKVLNVDPGQSDLASRVAGLLIQQDDFPQAIDVLKDAIKANSNNAEPYQQLAFIYTRYLKRTDQAIDYANRAIALNPGDIEGYQRLVEIELAAGQEKNALEALDRALKVESSDPNFGHASENFTSPFFLSPIRSPSLTN
jgi:tetratricopeptide (TPR) repeat protein